MPTGPEGASVARWVRLVDTWGMPAVPSDQAIRAVHTSLVNRFFATETSVSSQGVTWFSGVLSVALDLGRKQLSS